MAMADVLCEHMKDTLDDVKYRKQWLISDIMLHSYRPPSPTYRLPTLSPDRADSKSDHLLRLNTNKLVREHPPLRPIFNAYEATQCNPQTPERPRHPNTLEKRDNTSKEVETAVLVDIGLLPSQTIEAENATCQHRGP